jgi:hypothetical protein
LCCQCMWCQPCESTMGSCVMVLLSPVGKDATSLVNGGQQPAIAAAIAKDPMKAVVVPVLPWTPRGNQVYLPLRRLQPGRAPGRHAFRTLLTCDLYRSPPLGPPAPQLLDAISRRDRAGTGDGQALPRVGIEDREAWPPPPSGGRVMNNGIAPDRIRRGCPRRRSRARAPRTPGPPCVPDLQTFALPDAPDGLALHPPCSPFKR